MRFFVGVSAAFAAGGLIGAAIGVILTEDKYRKEYQEAAASMRHAMELARVINAEVVETPAETEEELDEGETILVSPDAIEVPEEQEADKPYDAAGGLVAIEDFKPSHVNPYHEAVHALDQDPTWSYIEEEEYQDDDGNDKSQITIIMDEHNPIFLENGGQIGDWAEKIGDNILRDFYVLAPPSETQVLFVRNNTTDTDYEVIKEIAP